MSQLDLAAADPPSSPPTRDGEHIECELRRPGSQVLRVVAGSCDGRRAIRIERWCIPRGRNHWWKYRSLQISPHEAGDVARAVVEASRRAKR